jgi:hypothetical protein
MKTLILAATALAFVSTFTTGASAGTLTAGIHALAKMSDSTVEKRRKPRVPGGSGCDDPRDVIQHPECAG